nr:hypothetical protein [uncultured Methanospirillum sp.]
MAAESTAITRESPGMQPSPGNGIRSLGIMGHLRGYLSGKTLQCHASNCEIFMVSFKRDSISLTNYDVDSPDNAGNLGRRNRRIN